MLLTLVHLLKYMSLFWFCTVVTYIIWTCIINAPRYISHSDPWWWKQKQGEFSVPNAINIINNTFQLTIAGTAIVLVVNSILLIGVTLYLN